MRSLHPLVFVFVMVFVLWLPALPLHAQPADPWRPRATCTMPNRSSSEGLTPRALVALRDLGLDHRITQTLNAAAPATTTTTTTTTVNTTTVNTGDDHRVDTTVDGKEVTAAVDISVRCLDTQDVRALLSRLAIAGFAAWLRDDGQDGWRGQRHIHAVWAEEPLKRPLRNQIKAWIDGRTGLPGDAAYTFWQPTTQERDAVSGRFEASRLR